MYKVKYVKVTITMDPEVLSSMKDHLCKLNESKTLKYVSQSDFITEAVKLLLIKMESE